MEKLSNPSKPDSVHPAGTPVRPGYARSRDGNPKAAMAIWSWKSVAGAPVVDRAARARREGTIRGVVGGVLGGVVAFFGHPTLATVVWTIAGITLVAALASPLGAYRWIQRGIDALAHGVGVLMSWLLLPVFFFGFCMVFGLLARRGRKDRLERWFDDGAATYWKERKDPPRKPEFYERQF